MVTVTMYSRTRCGLCDEARSAIEAVRAMRPFRFEEVRIDGDGALEREYGLRVPVVLVGGREEFEAAVDRTRLEALVARAGSPGAGPEGIRFSRRRGRRDPPW